MNDWAELSTCNNPTGSVSAEHETVISRWLLNGSITPSVKAFKKILITYPGKYCPELAIGYIGHCLKTEKNAFAWSWLYCNYAGTCAFINLKIINKYTHKSNFNIHSNFFYNFSFSCKSFAWLL